MPPVTEWSLEDRAALMAEIALTADLSPEPDSIHLVDPETRTYLYTTSRMAGPWSSVLRVPVHTGRNVSPLWPGDGMSFPVASEAATYSYCQFVRLLPEYPDSKWYAYVSGPRYWE